MHELLAQLRLFALTGGGVLVLLLASSLLLIRYGKLTQFERSMVVLLFGFLSVLFLLYLHGFFSSTQQFFGPML